MTAGAAAKFVVARLLADRVRWRKEFPRRKSALIAHTARQWRLSKSRLRRLVETELERALT